MVWKRLVAIICLCLAIAIAMPGKTFAYSVYSEGTLSSTYITYFKDIVAGLDPSQKYVAYRSGQYSYTLAVGNLSISGTTISSSDTVTLYVYESSSSGYSSNYTYSVSTVTDFSLDIDNYIVYSNLGNYPILEERGVIYEYTFLYVAIIIGLCMFIRSIFSFTYRLRK